MRTHQGLVVAGSIALALTSLACGGSGGGLATPEADVKAVKDLEATWMKDMATRDVEKFARYYSDDAVMLMPYEPMVTGKENIRAALKPMLADPNFALTFVSTRIEGSGDLIYSVGTYAMTVSDAIDKKPMQDKGKYLTVFRRQRGEWKVVVDMINSDLPVPSATYR